MNDATSLKSRSIHTIAVSMAILLFVAACGPEESVEIDDNQSSQNQSSENQPSENQSSQNQSDPESVASIFTDIIEFRRQSIAANCECDEPDEQQCLDETMVSEDARDTAAECAQQAYDDQSEDASQEIDAHIQCVGDAYKAGLDCMAQAENDGGDICSAVDNGDISICLGTLDTDLETCNQGLSGEAQSWLDDFDVAVESCFAELEASVGS